MGVFQYIQLFFNKVPHDFSEDWYLEFNPDVAEAVKKGAVSSGREHYLLSGKNEGRLYKKPVLKLSNDVLSDVLLRIETTNACNFKCSFCPHRIMQRKIKVMDDSLYEKIILDAERIGMHTLDLRNFGEPLTDNKLNIRCGFAKEHGFDNIYIHTNGYLLTKELYGQLIRNGMSRFIVSLSPRKEFAETRGESLFEVIFDNLLEISRGYDTDKILIDFINTGNSTEDEVAEFKHSLQSIGYSIREEIQLHNWAHGAAIKSENVKLCRRLWNSFTVLSDGKVALCCLDYNAEHVMGDLNFQTITEVINSEMYQMFRRSHVNKSLVGLCKNCDMPYVKG